MRRVNASEFVSLDGVMESPDQWHFPYFNDEMGEAIGAAMAQADAMLMGRVLYEEWAAYWPHQDPEENPVAVRMNGYPPKHVASTTLQEPLEWNNSTIIRATSPKRSRSSSSKRARTSSSSSSADLMNTLMRHGLVDELRLMVFPVVVGKGKRLFDDGEDGRILELVDSKTFGTGVVSLAYRLERS